MLIRFARTILIAAALATMPPSAGITQTRDTATSKPDDISGILASLRETAHMRDSLTHLAESTGGEVRDLLDEHRDLVCAVHEGLLEGMLAASRPAMRMTRFEPLRDRSAVCRLTAQGS